MLEYISFNPSFYLIFIELTLICYPITTRDISINRDRWGRSIQLEFLSGKMDKLDTGIEVIVGWDYMFELLELL